MQIEVVGGRDIEVQNLNSELEHEVVLEPTTEKEDENKYFANNDNSDISYEEADPDYNEVANDYNFLL